MTLNEMSAEYRKSGELCRSRLRELNLRLENEEMCEMERLRLRRKALQLETMLRDTIAISIYLKNYYGVNKHENNTEKYPC